MKSVYYSDIEIRKLIQKSLQDDKLSEHDKICNLAWLLYRIRLGGGCIRLFANLECFFRSSKILSKETFNTFQEKFIKHINEIEDSKEI